MQSTKPYLIRAIHEWCADQGFTPYLTVAVDATTRVPREFVKDDQIVLNVGLEATQQLMMGNEEISFHARFGGRSFPVVVPIARVAAIYARENGEGMAFEVTETLAVEVPPVDEKSKAGQKDASAEPGSAAEPLATEALSGQRPSGRPVLTRIK